MGALSANSGHVLPGAVLPGAQRVTGRGDAKAVVVTLRPERCYNSGAWKYRAVSLRFPPHVRPHAPSYTLADPQPQVRPSPMS